MGTNEERLRITKKFFAVTLEDLFSNLEDKIAKRCSTSCDGVFINLLSRKIGTIIQVKFLDNSLKEQKFSLILGEKEFYTVSTLISPVVTVAVEEANKWLKEETCN